jgi:hypothetical protein
MKNNRSAFPVHPFLFALFIILSPLSQNTSELDPRQGFRLMIAAVLAAAILFFLYWWMVRDAGRAAWMVSLSLFSFLGTGWLLSAKVLSDYPMVKNFPWLVFLFCFGLITIGLGNFWIWRKIEKIKIITPFLNLLMAIALIFPTAGILYARIQTVLYPGRSSEGLDISRADLPELTGEKPDIYYIVLDGYARQDVLEKLFGFDNSRFLGFLTTTGFSVAAESHSNYVQTALSIASVLNMEYLDEITGDWGKEYNNREPMGNLIQHNKIRGMLTRAGYRYIAISSGYQITDVPDADEWLSPKISKMFDEFERFWIMNSALAFLVPRDPKEQPLWGYEARREWVLFAMNALSTVATESGPKFVYVHIVSPHPPFVFDASGNPVEPTAPYDPGDGSLFKGTNDEYRYGYIQQLQFVNQSMEGVIRGILAKSATPPVILIQSDHGSGMMLDWDSLENTCLWERSSNLNALFMPPPWRKDDFYSSITSINSFRVIFTNLFHADYPLLEDKTYYSTWNMPYHFTEVSTQWTESCRP